MDKTTTDGASLSQVLTIFRRRWGTLVLVWALAAGLAALYTISRPKLYRPQGTLEIRPERSVVSSTTDTFADTNLWENYFRTQQNILTSEGLVAATIAALPPALRAPYEGPGGVQAFQKQIDLEQVRQSFILKVG